MRIPKYMKRSDRDTAYVQWKGKRHPLPGKTDSPESLEAYHDFIRRLLRQDNPPVPVVPRGAALTIRHLVVAYLDHATVYYAGNSLTTGEAALVRYASKPLVRMFGTTAVDDFGPTKLKQVREAMTSGSWIRPGENSDAWSRPYTNSQINRIRRIFKWGVEHELVPPAILEGLRAVPSLKAGRTEAREPEPVQPVADEVVEATLPHLTPVVAAMVRLQQITGMRSDNLCCLRWCDVDRSGAIWVYRPPKHKTSWRGKPLAIPLGPRAQSILQPFLGRPEDAWVFSPRESQAARFGKEPRRKTKHPKRAPGARYNTRSYRRSVLFGVVAANKARKKDKLPPIEDWTPHQLRHARATAIRRQYGIEAARVSLGHSRMEATEIYAELSLETAERIAAEIG